MNRNCPARIWFHPTPLRTLLPRKRGLISTPGGYGKSRWRHMTLREQVHAIRKSHRFAERLMWRLGFCAEWKPWRSDEGETRWERSWMRHRGRTPLDE
jgi:hypothetical protein